MAGVKPTSGRSDSEIFRRIVMALKRLNAITGRKYRFKPITGSEYTVSESRVPGRY
jgi:hypothetical protein